jgi:hypothetical protein
VREPGRRKERDDRIAGDIPRPCSFISASLKISQAERTSGFVVSDFNQMISVPFGEYEPL